MTLSLKPAATSSDAVLTAEMTRLVRIFRITPNGWRDVAPEYLDALHHLPHNVLHSAISDLIANAKSGDYFPRPGDIIRAAKPYFERHIRQIEDKRDNSAWPRWLEEIWGPEPDGPARRAAKFAQRVRK